MAEKLPHPADDWKWQSRSRLRGLQLRQRRRTYGTPVHSHERWQWLAVHRGRLEVDCDGECQVVRSNHFLLVPPGTPRQMRHDAKPIAYCFAFLDLDGFVVEDIVALPVPINPRSRSLLQAIMREHDQPRCENARALCEAHIIRLLVEGRRGLHRRKRLRHRQLTSHQTLIARLDTHLKNNLDKPLRRPELARLFGLSESQLARIVKAEAGETLSERLNRLRISEAERLLGDTDLSIAHIAMELGFTSFEPFTRLFKRHTGLSPTAWRRAQAS